MKAVIEVLVGYYFSLTGIIFIMTLKDNLLGNKINWAGKIAYFLYILGYFALIYFFAKK